MTDHHKNLARRAVVRRVAALVALLGATAAAHGQRLTGTAADIGRSTETWLALQRDNRAAGADLPMLGDAASLAYQRYLDSFKNKIPDTLGSPLGSSGGGGAAAGGQGAMQSN
ncbi:DUF3613 domain-containing protein [Burkholderia stagnalis]|uniref:DUF3613 domain-containing protein n=1 Tax=Burkholderia stagnalis TaxID=1503054 RepID=A0A104MZA7_9BURK|nr:DUF3613 domain-containing protein [Burkholderia stagnalis]KVC58763.1 hypothetical protein WS59_23295 [Burkholderia stagnalis]KVN15586.1 hypothetical protein WT10_23765 [Burkholderia stagnalis]KVN27750.1 hypothetical protein WT11_28485 [Burkholderia stagnalis]KVZ18536.1 hypothetical protein WT35_03910 [Burkholderia stagnalis]KWA45945.1 hypothetical protein WT42_27965 [Burkholderia stagnalis]